LYRAALFSFLAINVFISSASAAEPATEPERPNKVGELTAEADKALAEGRVERACRSFEEALTLTRTAELLISAGKCQQLLGKTASAWRHFTSATILAGSASDTTLEDRARELASRLAPRLSKLRIDVLAPLPEQRVECNGVVIPRTEWGVLTPVDPGELHCLASAPGRTASDLQLTIGAEADIRVLIIPQLKEVTKQPPPPQSTPPTSEQQPQEPKSPVGVIAFVTTAVGVVGIGTGIAFGVMTLVEVGDAEENPLLCPNKLCTKAGRIALDEAEAKGITSTVAFTVGGLGLATGATLFLLREFGIIGTQQPAVSPVVGYGSLGLEVAFD
jgi:hypothetical protein